MFLNEEADMQSLVLQYLIWGLAFGIGLGIVAYIRHYISKMKK